MDLANAPLLAAIAVLSFVLSFLGATVGLVLGHLRLPLLILYFGNPAAGAASNLVISGVGALAGALKHLREGRVALDSILLMGLPSAGGAILGALLVVQVNRFWSYLVIGVMLVVSGLMLVRPSKNEAAAGERPAGFGMIGLEIAIGLGLGILAAVTGLMLGSLRLPMMLRILKLDPRVAVGSNMAIGCLTALVGASAGLWASENLPWEIVGVVLAAVVPPTAAGGYLGGWLTGYLSKERVRALTGWIVAFTGAVMLVQGVLPTLARPSDGIPELFALAEDDDLDAGDFDADDD